MPSAFSTCGTSDALNRDRRGSLFPFAIERPWDRTSRVQTGVAALDHPVPALLEALDAETRLGPVSVEDGLTVVPFTLAQGADAVARDRSRDEAAGLGALDRPEHDARRRHDDDVLHGLLAVRRPAAARRHHGRDGLARPDVDDVPRRLVSHRRRRLAGLPGARAAGAGRRAPRRGDEDRRQGLGRAHRRQRRRRHRVRGSPRDVRGLQQRGRYVRAARCRRHARAGQEGHARHRLAPSLRSQRRLARRRRRAG